MRKIIIFLFVIILFFSLSSVKTYALLSGFNSKCLNGSSASAVSLGFGLHSATMSIVTGKEPLGNTETYIFICTDGGGCTAPSLDTTKNLNLLLFGQTRGGAEGRTSINKNNPTKTNNDGTAFVDDPIVITNDPCGRKTEDCPMTGHRFWWVQSANSGVPFPTATADEVLVDDGVGNDGGLKFASISFEDPIPTQPAAGGAGTKNNCNNVSWDPRGFVFDSETLNPVQNISITLFKKQADKTYIQVPQGIGLTNPLTTATNSGQFNFFVDPGLYKMTVNPQNAVIAEKSSLNPAYQRLFTDTNGVSHIYEKDMDIEEIAGRVAIAHIPVRITDKRLIIDTLQLIIKDEVVNADSATNKTKMHITGTVSHPKSKVTITSTFVDSQGSMGVLPPVVSATNELGEYDTYVNQEQFGPDGKQIYLQNINIKLELNTFYTRTNANQKGISYDVKPIPLYLEGVAYDESGAVIPNAVVGIYPFFSLKPMHMVIADQNGRFKIGSQNIPEANYTLKYESASGNVTVIEPALFIRQNVLLYEKEGINPYQTKTLSKREITIMNSEVDKRVTEKDLQIMSKTNTSYSKSSNVTNNESVDITPTIKQAPASFGVTVIVIVTTILILVGIAVFILLAKKH